MGWRDWLGRLLGLAAVTAVPVGRKGDGLVAAPAGAELDKPWGELQAELMDALEAWRKNPLARRIVGLTTSYVVGDGIRVGSEYGPLDRFAQAFYFHSENRLNLRLHGWCDELSRSGELFLALHTNPEDGMSYVRAIPASRIDRVIWAPGDYERELRYHEVVSVEDPDYGRGGRTWLSPLDPEAHGASSGAQGGGTDGDDVAGIQPNRSESYEASSLPPWVLHFAVNRPVGCVRGESDLAPMLPWLRRYSRWLEDRVRLNAAVRAFLWIVKVSGGMVGAKTEQYRRPPEPGSVIVTEQGKEEWEAVTPTLNASDAAMDGRAIRWMVAAGGPGIGLTDLGEAETSNLATASAMADQRERAMRARQGYFAYVVASVAVTAYNRAVELGKLKGRPQPIQAVKVGVPDISVADNAQLGQAAASLSQALQVLGQLGFQGNSFRALALRLVSRFAGERLTEDEMIEVVGASSDRREDA